MHQETVVSVLDLRYVSLHCPQCHAIVILDMQERSAIAERNNFFAPKTCPGCRADYDSALRQTIDTLQSTYRALLENKDLIAFRAHVGTSGAASV